MIPRYTLPEMNALWSDQTKFEIWLEIELLVCEAWAEQGKVPRDALQTVRRKAKFSVERIEELEQTLRHDVVAFTTNLAENIGPESRYVHLGLTSSDIVDTAQSVRMVRAADRLIADVEALRSQLETMARTHKNTIMMGRTHGMHSEPITFGLKCLLWHEEMKRNAARLGQGKAAVGVGKISGAVGAYAHTGVEIERYVCERLGLRPAPISTQIIQRDRYGEYLSAVAITGATIEKIALEIRNLQRTEIRELEEPFGKGQKGSSAMPHKRNPVLCEQLCGLARVLRANLMAALENVALWHERDISHSSVERVILPDSTILLDYMLNKLLFVLTNLTINTERMRQNLEVTKGLLFSQPILLELVNKGLTREDAYAIVQRNAMKTWTEGQPFRDNLLADPECTKHLTAAELDSLMDYQSFLRYVDTIYDQCGLGG